MRHVLFQFLLFGIALCFLLQYSFLWYKFDFGGKESQLSPILNLADSFASSELKSSKNLIEQPSRKRKRKKGILLFVTTHASDLHMDMFNYCWPQVILKIPNLIQSSDLLIFTTKPISNETLSRMWPTDLHSNIRIEIYKEDSTTSGEMKKNIGAFYALERAIAENWYEGYDWIIKINPDVVIRDDSWLLNTMQDQNVEGIFADCYRRRPECTKGCSEALVHFDFMAVRPWQVFRGYMPGGREGKVKYLGNGGMFNAELTFTQMVRDVMSFKKDRWLPNQTQFGDCRKQGEFSPVIHDHGFCNKCIQDGRLLFNDMNGV